MSKYKTHFKILVILFIVCILLELLLFGYKVVIHKSFERMHLIGNDVIEISKEEIKIDTTSDPDYNYITVDKQIENVYNITLQLKEKNQDMYIRIVNNSLDKLMQKSNLKEDNFKTYFSQATQLPYIKIAYSKNQMEETKIDKIIVNDNINYLPEANISLIEFAILFGIVIGVYGVIKSYLWITKTKKAISLEHVFLIFSLSLGMIMTFIVAPLSKYDEHAHFWRTYEIADGKIVSEITNELPISIARMVIDENGTYHIKDINYQTIQEKFKDDLNPEEKAPLAVGATSENSPFSYLPPLVGTFLGKVLRLKPIVIMYLGRLTNVIAYSILLYYAIKLMPKKKWKQIIMVIGLLPMTIDLAASYSPDTTIIGIAIFMLSYVMHVKFEEREVKTKDGIILGICTLLLTICKVVYFPMVLLFFLLPKEKFKNNKQRMVIFTIILAIFLAGNAIWKLRPGGSGAVAIRTSPTEQLYYALSDPMRTLGIFGNTLLEFTGTYLTEMLGGWNTPIMISFIFLLLLLFTIVEKQEEKEENIRLKKKDKIVLGMISLIETIIIFAGFYISWTKAHFEVIEGVQGRYFLPILPLVAILFSTNLVAIKIKNKEWKLFFSIVLLYVPIIINTIKAFS